MRNLGFELTSLHEDYTIPRKECDIYLWRRDAEGLTQWIRKI